MIDYVSLSRADIAAIERHAPDLAARGYTVGDTMRADMLGEVHRAAERTQQAALADSDRQLAEAERREARKPAAPRPFEAKSGIGQRMMSDHPDSAEFLRGWPSRDETLGWLEDVADAMKELRGRVHELESHGARFRGIYQRASAYRRGEQVTCKGSLWTALQDVPEGTVPGDSPEHWQMATKGGA